MRIPYQSLPTASESTIVTFPEPDNTSKPLPPFAMSSTVAFLTKAVLGVTDADTSPIAVEHFLARGDVPHDAVFRLERLQNPAVLTCGVQIRPSEVK